MNRNNNNVGTIYGVFPRLFSQTSIALSFTYVKCIFMLNRLVQVTWYLLAIQESYSHFLLGFSTWINVLFQSTFVYGMHGQALKRVHFNVFFCSVYRDLVKDGSKCYKFGSTVFIEGKTWAGFRANLPLVSIVSISADRTKTVLLWWSHLLNLL